MPDLDTQIREYFDEATHPVTIEDVFSAMSTDGPSRPEGLGRLASWRRPWIVAAAAAAVVIVLVGLLPVLLRPATEQPTVTDPSQTTSTTTVPTTTAAPPSTTLPEQGFVPGPLPEFGEELSIDPGLTGILAEIVGAADALGLEQPFDVRGGALPSFSVEAGLGEALSIRVFELAAEAEAQFAAGSEGRDTAQFPAPPLGDESVALAAGTGGRELMVPEGRFIVTGGLVVLEATSETALFQEKLAEFSAALDAVKTADRPDIAVSPIATAGLPSSYELGWGFGASLISNQDIEDEPIVIDRRYSWAVTPDWTRCFTAPHEFGFQEPQEYTEYETASDGTITRKRWFAHGDEEWTFEDLQIDAADTEYLSAVAECTSRPTLANDWGFEGLFEAAPSAFDANDLQLMAYQTAADEWVLTFDDHREVSLTLEDLRTTGLISEDASLEFDQFDFRVRLDGAGLVQEVDVQITATRAAIEEAFGIDLSQMPNETIEFGWGYEFSTEIGSSFFENF